MKFIMFIFVVFASVSSYASAPKNNISIPVSVKTGISQEQFNLLIDRVTSFYTERFLLLQEDLLGMADPKYAVWVSKNWESGVANAYASSKGNTNRLEFFGGVARHPEMTSDGFALLVCHEVGHLIGGAPLWTPEYPRVSMSIEGQADYWSARCFREVFYKDDHVVALMDVVVPETVKRECDLQWNKNHDSTLCQRISLAGLAMYKTLLKITRPNENFVLDFATPDNSVSLSIFREHPNHQCRLDTVFQAALCNVSFESKISDTDDTKGTCHTKNGHTVGVRPTCWYQEN